MNISFISIILIVVGNMVKLNLSIYYIWPVASMKEPLWLFLSIIFKTLMGLLGREHWFHSWQWKKVFFRATNSNLTTLNNTLKNF